MFFRIIMVGKTKDIAGVGQGHDDIYLPLFLA